MSEPVKTRSLPLFRIYSDDDDLQAVNKVIRRGSYWTEGPEVREFELATAAYAGRPHAVAFSNGTTALHALMAAYGIGPGDEVIVPSFTFISTANAAMFTGARPVFADIEPVHYGLDPDDVERKISPRTKAIIPVHYGGHPCRITELKALAERRGLLLIEDAAEAQGAKFDGKMAGSFGNAAMFSFCQNKIITTGEGGMVVTDDEELANRLRLFRSHGRTGGPGYFKGGTGFDYVSLGHNYRMSSITAALGISQLGKIEKLIGMRREAAGRLSQALADMPGIEPPREASNARHVFQLYTILLKDPAMRDGLAAFLKGAGIHTKVYFEPVHGSGLYSRQPWVAATSLPVTDDISSRVLSLPFYPHVEAAEIEYLISNIRQYVEGQAEADA